MRRKLGVLILAFLMLSLNLATVVVALIMAREFTTSSYRALVVAKQTDVSKGVFRKVTAYIVGDSKQTNLRPCIGASGDNLCNLVKKGVNVCAANFVPLGSKLYVDKFGECVVLDKMNARFGNGVDVAMKKSEHDHAVKFGVRRLRVIIEKDRN